MKFTLHRSAALVTGLALLVVTGASAASAGAQAAPSAQSVGINNFAFTPAEVTVPVGSSVRWTNQQNVRHTTTADNGDWDSGILVASASFDVTFSTPGDFTYHCDIHPDMLGVVHVVAAPAAEAPALTAVPDDAAPASLDGAVNAPPEPVAAPEVSTPTPASVIAPTPTPQAASYGY